MAALHESFPSAWQTYAAYGGLGIICIGLTGLFLYHILEWKWPTKPIDFLSIDSDSLGAALVISSKEELKNCLVNVEAIEGSDFTAHLPVAIRTQAQTKERRSGAFNLRPGQPKRVPLVRREVARNSLELALENEEMFNVLSNGNEYIIHITASCERGASRAKVRILAKADNQIEAEYVTR